MKMIMMNVAITLITVTSAAIVGKRGLRAAGSVIAAPLPVEAHSHKLALAVATADRLLHLLDADERKSERAKKESMSFPWMENKGENKEQHHSNLPWMETKRDERVSKGKGESQKSVSDKKSNDRESKVADHEQDVEKDEEGRKGASVVATERDFEDFLPACLVHTAELVHAIDASYTDMQIVTVLENECLLKKEFPSVLDHGFDDHKDCMHFARSLTSARHAEVADGSTDGYQTFCKEFYYSKARSLPGLDEAGEKAAGHGFSWVWRIWVIVIALGLFIAAVAAVNSMKKP